MTSAALKTSLDAQTVRLNHFISLLQQISEATAVANDPSQQRTLLHASVIRVINSGMAAQMLAKGGCVEEILSIGRTMVEVSVNAVYLQHSSDREMRRFWEFHPESSERVEGLLPSPINVGSPDGIISKIRKRLLQSIPTVPSRRVDRSWSNYSLLDRAHIADEGSQIPVMSLLVRRCYPRGHAAMMGAVGSLDYFISALHGTEGSSPDRRTVALTQALFGINLCLFTLAFYLSASFNLHMECAIEQAANAEAANPQDLLPHQS